MTLFGGEFDPPPGQYGPPATAGGGVGVGATSSLPLLPDDPLPPEPPVFAWTTGRVVGEGVAVGVAVGLGDGVGLAVGVAVRCAVAVADAAGEAASRLARWGAESSRVRKNTPPAAIAMPRRPSTVQPTACRAGVLKIDRSQVIEGKCTRTPRCGREGPVKPVSPRERGALKARYANQWSMGRGRSLAKGNATRLPVRADSYAA